MPFGERTGKFYYCVAGKEDDVQVFDGIKSVELSDDGSEDYENLDFLKHRHDESFELNATLIGGEKA